MKAQVITAVYMEQFPMPAWQRVVETSAVAEVADAEAVVEAAPRKARERGASAVEWVVITGIVVAIVVGVGWAISAAINKKASCAASDIQNANVQSGAGSTPAPCK